MKFLYPFAKRFIAGPDLKTAIPAIRKIQESGYFTSIDILGESVSTRLPITERRSSARNRNPWWKPASETSGFHSPRKDWARILLFRNVVRSPTGPAENT